MDEVELERKQDHLGQKDHYDLCPQSSDLCPRAVGHLQCFRKGH